MKPATSVPGLIFLLPIAAALSGVLSMSARSAPLASAPPASRAPQDADPFEGLEGVDKILLEAEALEAVVETELGRAFLAAAKELPPIDPGRVVYWDRSSGAALGEEEALALSESELAPFRRMEVDETLHYTTFYGTPLGYTRAIDIASANGLDALDGARILDFGYGGIGHLRALASLGAEVVGVEVMEIFRELYAFSGDTGEIPRASICGEGQPGRLELVHGRYPGEPDVARAVGAGFDLVISKNVLKKGYVHPERETDPDRLVYLGVDDETFLEAVFSVLNPGGLFLIYNLYPAQHPPEKPYLPWATGGCPFERELVHEVGFEIVAFDWNDTAGAHRMARALAWDRGPHPMDLERNLFAMVTLLRRPRGRG
jgi:SAM-dependent methyltransferase